MRILMLAAAAVASLVMAGCAALPDPENFEAQVQATCTNVRPFIDAIQVLDDADQLSAQNAARFANAKISYGQICAEGAVTDWASAAVAIASVYVIMVTINKEETT